MTKTKKSLIENDKVRAEIENLIEAFKTPDSLNLVAKSMFTRGANLPSDNWSVLNRIIQFAHSTSDARGYQAWKKVERYGEKGGAFNILAPILINTKKDKDKKESKDNTRKILIGFRPIPVWPVENTKGKDVDYGTVDEMPEFLGKEVAESWGLKIEQGFQNPSYFAYYSPMQKKILMATASQQTFFHELSHAADDRITGVKGGQDPVQEIVAEMSSAVLMTMCGLETGTSNTFNYIERYAKEMDKTAVDSIIPLISRIGKIVTSIMDESNVLLEKYSKTVAKR